MRRWREGVEDMNFKGKVALVVGASSGIGRMLALRLAKEGAKVVATARRADRLATLAEEIERDGGSCAVFAADAENAADAERVVQACVLRHGRIDLVMLNAGGAPAIDMRMMQAADVTRYMRSNYDVAVNYLFPVLQQMRRQGSGLVAQTNSLAGFLGVPLQGPYSAAKGALRLLIDTCRVEFEPFGIKFVSVFPGFVAT
jgi:NADP-dependent 3-hydroxy acid dehydrogenase YdfG